MLIILFLIIIMQNMTPDVFFQLSAIDSFDYKQYIVN